MIASKKIVSLQMAIFYIMINVTTMLDNTGVCIYVIDH